MRISIYMNLFKFLITEIHKMSTIKPADIYAIGANL